MSIGVTLSGPEDRHPGINREAIKALEEATSDLDLIDPEMRFIRWLGGRDKDVIPGVEWIIVNARGSHPDTAH